MERAADMCVEQVDRGRDRVADIEEARRTPDGWRVAGTLRSGDGWSCWIDNDGRIRNVDIGVPGYSANDGDARLAPTAGEQWNATNHLWPPPSPMARNLPIPAVLCRARKAMTKPCRAQQGKAMAVTPLPNHPISPSRATDRYAVRE
jgi:hypothetical protein